VLRLPARPGSSSTRPPSPPPSSNRSAAASTATRRHLAPSPAPAGRRASGCCRSSWPAPTTRARFGSTRRLSLDRTRTGRPQLDNPRRPIWGRPHGCPQPATGTPPEPAGPADDQTQPQPTPTRRPGHAPCRSRRPGAAARHRQPARSRAEQRGAVRHPHRRRRARRPRDPAHRRRPGHQRRDRRRAHRRRPGRGRAGGPPPAAVPRRRHRVRRRAVRLRPGGPRARLRRARAHQTAPAGAADR